MSASYRADGHDLKATSRSLGIVPRAQIVQHSGEILAFALDESPSFDAGVAPTSLRRAIQLSAVLSAVTVGIMLYLVVWLPRIVGQVPNYSRWMSTSPLKAVIPLLVHPLPLAPAAWKPL